MIRVRHRAGTKAAGRRWLAAAAALLAGALIRSPVVLASGTPDRTPVPAPATGPVAISGDPVPGLESFDALLTRFLAEHELPGAAVCVAREGVIVYDRGFGLADRASGAPVLPTSIFRTASLSKPVTAVAVMHLIEQGRLSLDDRAFERLGLGERLAAPGTDPRFRDITIRHLLQHTAGWDRGATFDPMFVPGRVAAATGSTNPPPHAAIIEFMLRRRLDFDPGSRYAYSNFGYCILGRVIEHVTGRAYDEYVRDAVLQPLGIGSMSIGRSRPEDRRTGEVVYHDRRGRSGRSVHAPHRRVAVPYVLDHEIMDAHGGWVATASDLVRLAAALDRPRPDDGGRWRLAPATVETMLARPVGPAGRTADGTPPAAYYACGWSVRPVGDAANVWHSGRIPGTSTLLVRRHDGLSWAVLFNASETPGGAAPAVLIDRLMHEAADAVTIWPAPGDADGEANGEALTESRTGTPADARDQAPSAGAGTS